MARTAQPYRPELLDAIEATEEQLSAMIGRWGNGIPGRVRLELIRVRQPLMRLLIRAGRRPVRRP
jgi:hypothetical protein